MDAQPTKSGSMPTLPTHVAQRVALTLVWVTVIVSWILFQRSTGRSTVATAQYLVDSSRGAWWALAAFVGFYALRPIILFPATLLTVAGGILFGPILGIAATVVGANLSAMVAYWIGRTLRGSQVEEVMRSANDTDHGVIERWSDKMRSESFVTVLTMRLLYLPYDLVNYGAGFLVISPWPFLAATAVGSVPGTIAFTLAGSSIDRVDDGFSGFDPRVLTASIVLFIGSLAVARLVRRRQTVTGA